MPAASPWASPSPASCCTRSSAAGEVPSAVRAFVAGGNGVLGRALLRLLIRDGHEVVATARTKEKPDLVRALGAEPVFVDLLNRDGLEFALRGCRWIFNAMSAIPKDLTPDASSWRAHDRVRTEGTRNLT